MPKFLQPVLVNYIVVESYKLQEFTNQCSYDYLYDAEYDAPRIFKVSTFVSNEKNYATETEEWLEIVKEIENRYDGDSLIAFIPE
jgi:hypothetical protein